MSLLTPAIDDLLKRLESTGQDHDRSESEHSLRLLNLERPTAELVYFLLILRRAKRVLEIGTSNGYSTIWIASALSKNGGSLISIERSKDKLDQAKANLSVAGLLSHVQLIEGDATEAVASLTGEFDVIFFDADRWSAPEQLKILLPRLSPSCLLMADNAQSHPEEIAGYLNFVSQLPNFTCVIVPVGKGLSLAYREQDR